MEEVREKVKGRISKLCGNATRDCDYECSRCESLNGIVDQILSLPEIAILHPDQSLPEILYNAEEGLDAHWVCEATQQDMFRIGWRRVCNRKE